jgi:hypothetical protein
MALVALVAPAMAQAGTYSWSQPGDFSGNVNPDTKYGVPAWGYYAGAKGSLTPMSCSGGICSAGGAAISASGGQLVMQSPGVLGSVTLEWNDPFTASQAVSVSGSISSGLCAWQLSDDDGSLAAGSPGALFATGTLPAGDHVYLTVTGVACTADLAMSITAMTPNITLTSPANGSTFTTGQPDFSGAASTAFDASSTVTVNVYAGSAIGGSPVETLTTTQRGGAYSALPSAPLSNGIYTAQAVQDDPVGSPNKSSPVTFTLSNSGPSLKLDSLGTKPLKTSKPTFTGTAGTGQQDSSTVTVGVWNGPSISGPSLQTVSGTVGSGGQFSAQASSLPDGRYTAVVEQASGGSIGFSNTVTFRIKVHPPALTINRPSSNGALSRFKVVFSGQAGDALGDASTISISLYRGRKVSGSRLGKRTARPRGSSWSLRWNRKLRDGTYTVRAVQTDDAGHITRITHTFLIVSGSDTIGRVSLTRSGVATVGLTCTASSGSCDGTVLVVTTRNFRTTPGGPSGPLRVLFAFVQVPAGRSTSVSRSVPGAVLAVLRRQRSVTVRVAAALSHNATASTVRSLKLGS